MFASCTARWAATRSFRSPSRPQILPTLCNLHSSIERDFSSQDSLNSHALPATPLSNSETNETEPARPKAYSSFVSHAMNKKPSRTRKRGKKKSLKRTALVNVAENVVTASPFGITGILQRQILPQEAAPNTIPVSGQENSLEDPGMSKPETLPSAALSNLELEQDVSLDRPSDDFGHNDGASSTAEPARLSEGQIQRRTHGDDRPQMSKQKQGRIRESSKPSIRPHQTNHEPKESPKSARKFISKNVTTSEWVLVSNIPPMSKLSDLIPSLSDILQFEIKKGIIDLDKLLLNNNNTIDASAFENQTSYQRLQEMNALHSLYSTQTIKSDSGIPLVTFHPDPNQSLPSQLLLEARLHLSYRARPMGWFLRFSNRSIAHAVRCHVREAERHEGLIREQFESEKKEIRRERGLWTEGLWRKVWEDCGAEAFAKKKKRSMMEEESVEERGLMWGDDAVSDEDWDESDPADVDIPVETALEDGVEMEGDGVTSNLTGGQSVDEFFDEYARSHPYPMHSTTMPSVESVFGYHHLKCGSTPLQIQEFTPIISPLDKKRPSWEQNSFHLGNLLDLSDSVIRVETNSLRTTLDEVKYLFRGYDLKSIWPGPSGDQEQLPSWCADLPKSIGWNLRRHGTSGNDASQAAVDILVEGKNRNTHFSSGNGERGSTIGRPSQHMFLVRFATPADARMAVRDKQGIELNQRRLMLSQYPRVELM
ncbi:hypothetical protein HJC23_011981 [Cyclotella cryptica]|uniref:RRM domain-containing protein n=1 Tax=Cyclotella cryptica TaxID=29204 RepID=A0ABD3QRD7_9STRA|eukprot:CCRYP_003042-RA/>CCRYP_003042-RA protein AED:0.29 eAED:0.29 QI:0/-1/0/1/-1/1/1/0/709